ncbi:Regulator of telomere elongation helicase 1, partial [Nowakowskiella sp. JEL0078]
MNKSLLSPNVAILGSRDQLCLNREVLASPTGTARTALCRQKILKKRCEYFTGYEALKNEPQVIGEIMDIEDLVKFGQEKRQPVKSRHSHNLESSCVEASSFDLTPAKLALCITEAQKCIEISSQPYFQVKEITAEDFITLKAMLLRFEEAINLIEMKNLKELVKPGEFIYELFDKANIRFENAERVMKVIDT